ncbi:unnamed protein product [Effrenium voratum]|nr:unnamed protein product [Effrenium voratum]
MLRGLALLKEAEVLCSLPPEEQLPPKDVQVLQRLPEAIPCSRGSYASQKKPGSARCFCTVLSSGKSWSYIAALAINVEPGQKDGMLDTFVCLWSDVPQIISRGFLQSLARLCATAFQPESGSYSFDCLAQLWAWLLCEVPVPPRGCALHLHAAAESTAAKPSENWEDDVPSVVCSHPSGTVCSVPASHVALGVLLERLSLEDALMCCRLLLLERQVVFRSSSCQVLVAACEAFARVLLFPFQWRHVYCPNSPVGRLKAAGPWLLGLRREVLELGPAALTALPLDDHRLCSVFDLDLGEADLEPAVDRLPELPPGLASKLRAGLSRLLVRPRPEVPVAEAVFNMELQKVFFESLAVLFSGLRQHMARAEGTCRSHFDVQGYVHSKPVEAQPFCRALAETTAFRELLQEMVHERHPFEEAAVQEQLLPDSFAAIVECLENEEGNQGEQGVLGQDSNFSLTLENTHGPSFHSCFSDLSSSSLTSAAKLLLCEGPFAWLELHLHFGPVSEVGKGRVLAEWTRPASLEPSRNGKRGAASGVQALVAAVKAQLLCEGSRWAEAIISQLTSDSSSSEQQLVKQFAELGKVATAGKNHARAEVVFDSNLPACFRPAEKSQASSPPPDGSASETETQAAEFAESEALPMVLNSAVRCLSTPRSPCALAVHLLRRAYSCLYSLQTETLKAEVKLARSKSELGKKVRFSRVSTPLEDNGTEFLSPAGQRRKTLRSMTTSHLSLSPSRNSGPRSPLSLSPERVRDSGRKGRSSDPSILTSPVRSPRRGSKERYEAPQAVETMCRDFCELQLCRPEELGHEERISFWLNVLNASMLAWICAAAPGRLESSLFPMHVLLNFLQRSLVNVAGQVFSLLELEHIVLRAHSRAPKFGWVQCPKGRPGDPKTDMGLERAAPEVNFGIFYPLRFGCARLRIYHPQAVNEELLLNCAQYLVESMSVDRRRRRVTLPPLLKYYSQDFGSSHAALLPFAQSVLEATPVVLEKSLWQGRAMSSAEARLARQAPEAAQELEQLRKEGGFNTVAVHFADFNWHLDVPEALGFTEPCCPELEDLHHSLARERPLKVVQPPGRPERPDLRRRRYE